MSNSTHSSTGWPTRWPVLLAFVVSAGVIRFLDVVCPADTPGAHRRDVVRICGLPEGGNRTVGVKLWRGEVDQSSIVSSGTRSPSLFYREGSALDWEPRFVQPPRTSDGVDWVDADDAADEEKAAFLQGLSPPKDSKTEGDFRRRLEANLPAFETGLRWSVYEDDQGYLFASCLNRPDTDVFRFDCLDRLLKLLQPPADGLTGEKSRANSRRTVRITADVRGGLRPFFTTGREVVAFTQQGTPDPPDELLLVRRRDAKDGQPAAAYDVLWFPGKGPDHGWDQGMFLDAFGVGLIQPLGRDDYESLRSLALFPEDPRILKGRGYLGFRRDPTMRVALRDALAWRTTGGGRTAVWKLRNSDQVKYLRTDDVLNRTLDLNLQAVEFGPEEDGFNAPASTGPIALRPSSPGVPVGEKIYPPMYTADLGGNCAVRFRLVTTEGGPPFYLMDEEVTVRQLLAVLHQSDLQAGQDGDVRKVQSVWWRTPEGRAQEIEAAIRRVADRLSRPQVPAAAITPSPTSAPVSNVTPATTVPPTGPSAVPPTSSGPWTDPRVLDVQAVRDDIRKTTDMIRTTFAREDGEWEAIYAAWLFRQALDDIEAQWPADSTRDLGNVIAPTVKSRGGTLAVPIAVAEHDADWRWRRSRYELYHLMYLFRHRALAWAEVGWVKGIKADDERLSRTGPPPRPLDGEPVGVWSDFYGAAWHLVGPGFANPETFEREFHRYKVARQKLMDFGTSLGARRKFDLPTTLPEDGQKLREMLAPLLEPAVHPLDAPVTNLSPRAAGAWVAQWNGSSPSMVTPTPDALRAGAPPGHQTRTVRLPTSAEWARAARVAWSNRADSNNLGGIHAAAAPGSWTGDRLRPWPLHALQAARGFQDRTGSDLHPHLLNLIGNVAEMIEYPVPPADGGKGPAYVIMGGSYRTELTRQSPWPEVDPYYVLPAALDHGWDHVGLRLVLAADSAPPADNGFELRKPPDEATVFGTGSLLEAIYRKVYAEAHVRGAMAGDPLDVRWKLDRFAVSKHLGPSPEWWTDNLRPSLWFDDGRILQGQRSDRHLLEEASKLLGVKLPVAPRRGGLP